MADEDDTKEMSLRQIARDEYESLRKIKTAFIKTVEKMDANNKLLHDIFSAVGGKMLPFDMDKVGEDAMPDKDATDDGFLRSVAGILKDASVLERMSALATVAKSVLELRRSFASKHRKLQDRVDKMLGPKDKTGKRVKSKEELDAIKSQPEYITSLKLCANVNATVNTLDGRLDYVCDRFFEARKAALNRVLGCTEVLRKAFKDVGVEISSDVMVKHDASTAIRDIEALDDRMGMEARTGR